MTLSGYCQYREKYRSHRRQGRGGGKWCRGREGVPPGVWGRRRRRTAGHRRRRTGRDTVRAGWRARPADIAPARLREPHEQNEGAARAQVERGDGQARAAEKRQVLRVKAERGFPVRGGLCVQHRRTEGEIAGRRLLIGQFGEGGMVLPAAIRPAPHLSTIRHGEGIRRSQQSSPDMGSTGSAMVSVTVAIRLRRCPSLT